MLSPATVARLHRHAAATTTEAPYTGPVTLVENYVNRAAHGGICRTETCSCGATRKVLVNGPHRETSPWS